MSSKSEFDDLRGHLNYCFISLLVVLAVNFTHVSCQFDRIEEQVEAACEEKH